MRLIVCAAAALLCGVTLGACAAVSGLNNYSGSGSDIFGGEGGTSEASAADDATTGGADGVGADDTSAADDSPGIGMDAGVEDPDTGWVDGGPKRDSGKSDSSAPCGPSTCSTCCSDAGCAAANANAACGTGGHACTDCASSGKACTSGACVDTSCVQSSCGSCTVYFVPCCKAGSGGCGCSLLFPPGPCT